MRYSSVLRAGLIIFKLSLPLQVLSIDSNQVPQTSTHIYGRAPPPPPTPVGVAPQTVAATGVFSTLYYSYLSVSENSAVTQVIDGTSTVLPMWYCDPTLSAPACKGGCPSNTLTTDASCPTDYNMILVLPPLVLVGAYIPPPPGLPTLKINSDGVATPEKTPAPPTNTLPQPTSSSEEPIRVDVPCTIPSLKAADKAKSINPTPPVWTPPAGSPAAAPTEALPVLPITTDPDNPTSWMLCGAGAGNPYAPGGFYQFRHTFSRDDGLFAIQKFCEEQVVVPRLLISAIDETVEDSKKSVPEFSKTYDTPGGSGKVIISVNIDKDNQNAVGLKCPNGWRYAFASYTQCRQFFAQTIEFCDNGEKLASSDITWKSGGTFFSNCVYFSVAKAPTGKD